MPKTRTTTVNTTELTADDIEALIGARYSRKGWNTEVVWETGRHSGQPRLKVIRKKVTES